MDWKISFLLTTLVLVRILNYSIYYHTHIMYYGCILSNWNKLFLRDIHISTLGVAMIVCWVISYCCYPFPLGFKCMFELYSLNSLYHNTDIGTMWHWAWVSCTPSQSIGLFFGCALFWGWVSLYVPLTNSLVEFYFILRFMTIIGIFIAILFILNNTFRLSVTM